jgi:acetyl esterase/lipase
MSGVKILVTILVVVVSIVSFVLYSGPPIDFRLKIADFVAKILFYACGAHPGGNFSRKCLRMIELRAPTTEHNPKDGIISRDIQIPSYFEKNVTVPARLFEPDQTLTRDCQETKLPLIIHYHGGGFTIGAFCNKFVLTN